MAIGQYPIPPADPAELRENKDKYVTFLILWHVTPALVN